MNDSFASELGVPKTVAMADPAGDLQQGLLAQAVGAGLQVMGTLVEADVTAVCGPRSSGRVCAGPPARITKTAGITATVEPSYHGGGHEA
jgi:hypothetical protein